MLGIIGFLCAAIVIGCYAISSGKLYTLAPQRQRYSFATGYSLLAINMILWMLCIVSNDSDAIRLLMLSSDIILLVATLAMANVKIDLGRYWWRLPSIILVSAVLISMRAYVFPPTAYVSGGLLHFNLTNQALAIILAAFTLIWLPASAEIGQRITSISRLKWLQNLSTYASTVLIIITGLFLAARRPQVIIALFIILIALFAGLVCFNLWLRREYRMKEVKNGR